MAEGQVYVEVDASVVNGGIAPMAIVSSNPELSEGQTYMVVWLLWWYNTATGDGGFTGNGWFFDDPNNVLKTEYGTEDIFISYLKGESPPNLDDIFIKWDAGKKTNFLNAHKNEIGTECMHFFS